MNKFGIVYSDVIEKAVTDKLNKSFTNNYFLRWKNSRNRVFEFEKKEEKWLENQYKPFENLDLKDQGS